MITKELLSVLAGCGWACKKDDAGDYYCLIEKYDFTVQIIPSLHARRDHIRASLMPSVSTADFSFAVSVILGEDLDFVPIINSNLGVSKLNSIGREEVERLSNDALEWASVQNLSEGLTRYRELPPDSKGDLPVRHLAALALDGRVQKLREYMEGFERGERMGFVPYISLQMIGRAFELAVKVKSNNSDS